MVVADGRGVQVGGAVGMVAESASGGASRPTRHAGHRIQYRTLLRHNGRTRNRYWRPSKGNRQAARVACRIQEELEERLAGLAKLEAAVEWLVAVAVAATAAGAGERAGRVQRMCRGNEGWGSSFPHKRRAGEVYCCSGTQGPWWG